MVTTEKGQKHPNPFHAKNKLSVDSKHIYIPWNGPAPPSVSGGSSFSSWSPVMGYCPRTDQWHGRRHFGHVYGLLPSYYRQKQALIDTGKYLKLSLNIHI